MNDSVANHTVLLLGATGRTGGRVAFVVGGRARDDRPLAWIDKQNFQPLRIAAAFDYHGACEPPIR